MGPRPGDLGATLESEWGSTGASGIMMVLVDWVRNPMEGGGMGKLVAIEGIDGSGKKTQTARLETFARDAGLRIAVFSFPRYGLSHFAQSVADYLNGDYGDLAATPPEFAALLFAGDRLEAKRELTAALEANDLVLCDRFVASNVAHQSARLPLELRQAFRTWITKIEFGVYGLPKPTATVYLDVPAEVAHRAIMGKARRVYTDKTHDIHEADRSYLAACHRVYAELAGEEWSGTWVPVACIENQDTLRAPEAIGGDVIRGLREAGVLP